ncbi:hypothetical protein J4E90_007039 [Alternaria incomplexa]|uniref:uncharacterized protein n=1 Tax=Alternaria incomplexa TaxID=1187928 RepID=UPI00221E9ECF|nr:uncharacterized protein J4E90_007039 [Alternaria incomplexa]KAI4910783.1 hypothetical protein J4E90_007039 [Alternaria incomplexa]
MPPPNPPPYDTSIFGTSHPPLSARHGVQAARRPPHNSGPMFNPHTRINDAINSLCAIRHSMSELETQHRSVLETKDAEMATLQQRFKNKDAEMATLQQRFNDLNTLHRSTKARIDEKVLLQGKLQNDMKILKRELAAEKAKKGIVDQDMEKRLGEARQENGLLTAKVAGLEKELADERARGKENRDAKRELEVMKTKLADMVKGEKVKVEVVE